MSQARAERAALVETMGALGPDVPTMCDGWTARDLAVHLILRERRPDAALGMFVPALAGYTRSVERRYAGKPWPDLLQTVLDGPPWYSPFRPLDSVLNLAEMFVHHEDVLRGGADPTGPFLPRKLSPALERALERPLKLVARGTLRSSPARVTLGSVDGRELVTAGRGEAVTVTGTAGELLLWAFGRAPADVKITGPEAAVQALSADDRSV
ncbi:TIGR03085 family metal-binding protein [Gordonia sp. HY285]|uniref:TIGR03085 family metal-binding protein n=1 Tax=Gordonia liuliyuniae TaxID=2911517 RepID=UPI001F0298CA|nr:TIGR03085 family metal-binding protein [Gordonia liuliyuniae]MCF8610840.1 TIGR03085 family metal-binding protein [Gordonia liuliyuniae]